MKKIEILMGSINELSEWTGSDRRTIKKRLETLRPTRDGRSLLYPSPYAVRLVIEHEIDEGTLRIINELTEKDLWKIKRIGPR